MNEFRPGRRYVKLFHFVARMTRNVETEMFSVEKTDGLPLDDQVNAWVSETGFWIEATELHQQFFPQPEPGGKLLKCEHRLSLSVTYLTVPPEQAVRAATLEEQQGRQELQQLKPPVQPTCPTVKAVVAHQGKQFKVGVQVGVFGVIEGTPLSPEDSTPAPKPLLPAGCDLTKWKGQFGNV